MLTKHERTEKRAKMREDFGFGGDEFLIGDCQEDWQVDWLSGNAKFFEDHQRVDEEGEFDDYDPNKGDDIGQELDMADPSYTLDDGDDYLECEWEE